MAKSKKKTEKNAPLGVETRSRKEKAVEKPPLKTKAALRKEPEKVEPEAPSKTQKRKKAPVSPKKLEEESTLVVNSRKWKKTVSESAAKKEEPKLSAEKKRGVRRSESDRKMNPEENDPMNNLRNFNPFKGRVAREVEDDLRAMEEMMRHEQRYTSQKFKAMLQELRSDDEIRILEAITTLSTELSLAQEDQLGGFPLETLLHELVKCLHRDGIPDIICKFYFVHLIHFSTQPCLDQSYIGH
eukprot:TRINITY_DN5468_c0_g1_i2.p1 TRINITY_DN5468_c0_g1~~TRINITY_DN5468_c0_g1_i2.p1  ORF type:complete len:242 (+),score=55.45 TRINITY_DN5468_c0_g1_i2:55-780(+)